jgi:hypothetical protein
MFLYTGLGLHTVKTRGIFVLNLYLSETPIKGEQIADQPEQKSTQIKPYG